MISYLIQQYLSCIYYN